MYNPLFMGISPVSRTQTRKSEKIREKTRNIRLGAIGVSGVCMTGNARSDTDTPARSVDPAFISTNANVEVRGLVVF